MHNQPIPWHVHAIRAWMLFAASSAMPLLLIALALGAPIPLWSAVPIGAVSITALRQAFRT